jgi:hypothetical protein
MPGESNFAADATSRHPSPAGEIDLFEIADQAEQAIVAAIRRDAEAMSSLSWQVLADETHEDHNMQALLETVRKGFTEDDRHLPHASEYWRYREALYEQDGVVLYDDRVVVPPALRQHFLNLLHAAHQGTSSMELRARSIVFWPGITGDISRTRAVCKDCVKNTTSQL